MYCPCPDFDPKIEEFVNTQADFSTRRRWSLDRRSWVSIDHAFESSSGLPFLTFQTKRWDEMRWDQIRSSPTTVRLPRRPSTVATRGAKSSSHSPTVPIRRPLSISSNFSSRALQKKKYYRILKAFSSSIETVELLKTGKKDFFHFATPSSSTSFLSGRRSVAELSCSGAR